MWANSSSSLTECNTTVAICPFWNANFNINQKHSLLWICCVQRCYVHTKLPGGPRRIESANVAQATMHLECDRFEKMLGFLVVCFVMFPLDDCVSMHGYNISPGILVHTQQNQFLPWVFLTPSMIGLHLGFFKSLDRFINAMVTIREPETTGHT